MKERKKERKKRKKERKKTGKKEKTGKERKNERKKETYFEESLFPEVMRKAWMNYRSKEGKKKRRRIYNETRKDRKKWKKKERIKTKNQ